RNAFQFDPLYAVNISQVDPLPHQIEAIYHHILQNPHIRFLLADDPGAGKTIMSGLLLKELKYRGLVDRTLILAPGHLKDQWRREMKEKFQEHFMIIDRGVMNASWGRNIFAENNQVIVSLDFAKQDDVMFALKDTVWDLCIVDEAHKMSAFRYGEKITKTQRYHLGELLSPLTKYLIFLTATPHRGDPENFRLLLDLLEPGFFAHTQLLMESIQNKDNPLFLRRLKEDLKNFEGVPLFPPRTVETIKYRLSDHEQILYNEVTQYVQQHFNKALAKDKRNVAFALTILQRRLASSVRAVRKSLERRAERLKDLYQKGQIIQAEGFEEEYLEDLAEKERWQKEEELLEKLTSAETLEELKQEIEKLEELVALAKEVEKKEIETKLSELKKVIESEKLHQLNIKLLIFTESKDTLEYLVEKLKKWGYSVATIHGGMNLDARIHAENEFRNQAQIMVSTEAGGEGINLQFCWLMVNYDIPWNPNRLEQRMGRIHRYGQQHEVHIYNLVAVSTREGRILEKLFEKLEKIKQNLGSDRVFDVIGDVIVGKSLKDLIIDAIANRRTLDEILQDFEKVPDQEAIEMVKEASLEALATRHIDLAKILGEQRKAKENRLVPEYIEEFFKRAAEVLNIKMNRRQDGFWHISVPFEIRNRSHEFKIKYGEVLREYTQVSFDKEKAFKGQAEFVAMGHPLLEAVVDSIQSKFSQYISEGAVFVDPEGKRDGLIWFLETEIVDGKNEKAGKRLFAVYQDANDNLSFINPAILWDLKPDDKVHSQIPNIPLEKDTIIAYVITDGLNSYKQELLQRRQHDAEIKRKYGIRSLESMILESEAKIAEYETRRIKGENIPDVIIQNEVRKKEDLIRKKERLEKEIEAEIHLYPSEPRIIAIARVVPASHISSMVSNEEIENIGMQVALEYEKNHQRIAEDVSVQNLGYDIRSRDENDNYRYIEVKARAQEGPVALTPNEWLMAQRLGDDYWLYIVTNAASQPNLYLIQNPAAHLQPDEEIDIVRYVVKDWKKFAVVA
ncbi:MAG: helicase-related protein, partial [Candidatus Helarchaeota archaeon]